MGPQGIGREGREHGPRLARVRTGSPRGEPAGQRPCPGAAQRTTYTERFELRLDSVIEVPPALAVMPYRPLRLNV